jgi:hypothetical protein
MHEPQSKAWGSPARELAKISKKNAWSGLILKGEMGDSSSFRLRFQSDNSRADVSSSLVSHCLLGSGVLSGMGAGIPKGDLAW